MNKNDLVNQVSDSTGLSKSDSAKAVDSVFESITSTLKSGGDVRLVGFGTFLVSKRKATTGRNLKLVHQYKYLLQMFLSLGLERH